MLFAISLITVLGYHALATPIFRALDQDTSTGLTDYTTEITIHESCNSTQRRMLETALSETYNVVTFAKDYIVSKGPGDPVFQLYFGNVTSSFSTAVGVYESILTSNKDGVLFRCDNPDGNCRFEGWRGHWRGENGTSETVICDASYTDRLYNNAFCMFGFQLAVDKPSSYWSIDLLHRLLHVPQITNGLVDHFAETLDGVLENAANNGTYSAIDSDALQYFAAHVYAVEVAKGGEACIGHIEHDHAGSKAASPATTSAPATSTPTAASASPPTSSKAADCHTHADGSIHCV